MAGAIRTPTMKSASVRSARDLVNNLTGAMAP
jgi:hypothetical protein